MSLTTISKALDAIEQVVIQSTGMKLAPGIITTYSVPSTSVDGMFSIELQSSNTGRENDRVALRMSHDLTIRFVHRVNPNRGSMSYKDALEREEKLIRGMMVQSSIPSIRTNYVKTSRTLTASREQLIVEVSFNLEHNFPLTNTETIGN